MPIRKVKKGWKIDNVPGIHKTRKDAVKRLQAIKAKQSKFIGRPKKQKKVVKIDTYSKDITKFFGVKGANAGKKNGMYKHGRWSTANKPKKTSCRNCGAKSNLLFHHINRNELDNRKSNIRVLCKPCHERLHKRGHNFSKKKSPMASKRRAPNGRKK